jgi:hypothetical protein
VETSRETLLSAGVIHISLLAGTDASIDGVDDSPIDELEQDHPCAGVQDLQNREKEKAHYQQP